MKPILVFDCECYSDYFSAGFKNIATGNVVIIEMFDGLPLDVDKINRIFEAYCLVGFNSDHYDFPVLSAAMQFGDCAKVKAVSDAIIVGNQKHWQVYRDFGIVQPEVDSVDLIEVAPGQVGLKQYAGRLHAQCLQDLPIEPGACITPDLRDTLRTYLTNDLNLTENLYRHLLPQIDLRRTMTAEYGIDLRSKSDAQIAEAVIKAEVEKLNGGRRLSRAELPANTKLTYTPPAWIGFMTRACREVADLVIDADYRIDQWGSPMMPTTMEDLKVAIGDSCYRLGIGGLHSSETRAVHPSDGRHILVDRDVASYYPSIILQCGLAPSNMGEHFTPVYRSIVERRLAAKAAGDKVTDGALKITINGSFGKLGSKWSVLYAPALFLQVTLTGQLALLMLIERLEAHDIPVVSANTDGVVIKCPVGKVAEMDAIVCWWQTITGFNTEATEYAALYSRDVNNYIAIKPDGTVKTKGAYASTTLMKSPQNEICIDAVIAFLRDGTPLATTVGACRDVRRLLTLRQVKGGAVWQGQHLGRVVRWYYGKTGAPITYQSNGNKVAKSDGAIPCMTLPAALPTDIDLDWYITEAASMLDDLGLPSDPGVHLQPQEELFA